MRFPFATAALLIVLVLCTAAADESPQEPTPAADRAAKLTDVVRALHADVTALRGLEFRTPVRVRLVDEDEAVRYAVSRLKKFQAQSDLYATERAWKLLGLLEPRFDLQNAYLDFVREQAGGYYDPGTKEFYILEGMPDAIVPTLAVHELTHALDDQHFDLDARIEAAMQNDDLSFAVGAVHEGAATLLMGTYLPRAIASGAIDAEELQRAMSAEAGRMASAAELPAAVLRPITAAYSLGASFLAGDRPDAGVGYPVDRVNATYRDGPASSEQILHPEKYWDPSRRDAPTAVPLLPDAPGERWSRIGDGVLGELMIGSLVGAATPNPTRSESLDPAAWTNEAAAGWDGDRWELWRDGSNEVVLLNTIWDSEADAREFAAALASNGFGQRQAGHRVAVVAGAADGEAGRLLDLLLALPIEPR